MEARFALVLKLLSPSCHDHLAWFQVLGEVLKIAILAFPGTGEIGLTIAQLGRRCVKVRLAVCRAWDTGDFIVDPLCMERGYGEAKSRRGDEEHAANHGRPVQHGYKLSPVSYTHLTLPTIYSV